MRVAVYQDILTSEFTYYPSKETDSRHILGSILYGWLDLPIEKPKEEKKLDIGNSWKIGNIYVNGIKTNNYEASINGEFISLIINTTKKLVTKEIAIRPQDVDLGFISEYIRSDVKNPRIVYEIEE